jgi:hypothetical protein
MEGVSRAVFHRISRGSSKVSLGFAIPYHSMPCRRSTPSWPTDRPEVGRPQGKFIDLVFGCSLDTPINTTISVNRLQEAGIVIGTLMP